MVPKASCTETDLTHHESFMWVLDDVIHQIWADLRAQMFYDWLDKCIFGMSTKADEKKETGKFSGGTAIKARIGLD